MFEEGFVSGEAIVPPILRGLHAVPAAKEPLGQLAVLNLVREGVVRKPPDLGPHRMAMPAFAGNPLSYWRGAPVSFLHFEKTAGTSLASRLTNLFHPLQIDDDPERGTAPHVLSAFPPTIGDDLRRKDLVWGHYDLPALHRLGPERRIVTLLREPKARVLSLRHFWRSVDPSLVSAGFVGFNVAAAHELDLLGFLTSDDPFVRNYIDNVYVRRLAGAYVGADGDDPLRRDPDGTVRRALAGLRTIACVGVVERLDASVEALGRAIGADLAGGLARRNTSEGNGAGAAPGFRRIAREAVTPEVLVELQRLTGYDAVIYQHAVAGTDPVGRA